LGITGLNGKKKLEASAVTFLWKVYFLFVVNGEKLLYMESVVCIVLVTVSLKSVHW